VPLTGAENRAPCGAADWPAQAGTVGGCAGKLWEAAVHAYGGLAVDNGVLRRLRPVEGISDTVKNIHRWNTQMLN